MQSLRYPLYIPKKQPRTQVDMRGWGPRESSLSGSTHKRTITELALRTDESKWGLPVNGEESQGQIIDVGENRRDQRSL